MTRNIALITGASSGIGAAYARLLADDHDLILVARRAGRLVDLAEELRARGAAVEVLPADLMTRDGIAAVADRLAAGDVRMLISNAGAGGYAPLIDVDPADIEPLLTLNAVAPIQLVRAALPGMLAAGEGTVVTVASLRHPGIHAHARGRTRRYPGPCPGGVPQHCGNGVERWRRTRQPPGNAA
ncbi:SDR family NAD(P)-dependent oxidoreductase [Streptomyces scabichelini]|uniref:SDR family NAD(P)-dependent oxidoreductase n=1 Tax=Streptomyces scabichelini TaxID=2711217 RepID=UPI001F49791E|nr:SDR family NAD(P)-dependent oxidoreductase [Streptomyces scabichelini]